MGRFVYGMNVSLDLLIEQVPGDHGAGEWVHIDEELHRAWEDHVKGLALLVQGRVIHELMEESWPQARYDESLPAFMRDYGETWVAKSKVLVSRTRLSAEHNTRIIGGEDAIEQLAALRATTDGDIGVGGAGPRDPGAPGGTARRAGARDASVVPRLRQGAVRRLRPTDRSRAARAAIVRHGRHDASLRHSQRRRRLMLTQVADGVPVHQSPLIQNNSVVVEGSAGVLLVDPGITNDELLELARRTSRARAGRRCGIRDASRLGSRALASRARRGAARHRTLCSRRHWPCRPAPSTSWFPATAPSGVGSGERGSGELRARIDLDRAYVHALREGGDADDPRVGSSAKPGWEWVSDIHAWQVEQFQV